MATIKELKHRMKSIKNIAQITKAVEMVAAVKMRRSQAQALRGQPYSEKITEVLQALTAQTNPNFHPLLRKKGGEKTLILLLFPNRGLCGALINNLGKEVLQLDLQKKNIDFILVGKKGENLLLKLKLNLIAEFADLGDRPTFAETIPISQMVISGFIKKKYRKVVAIYPRFINTLTQKASRQQILPIKEKFQKTEETWPYILYEPNPKEILFHLLPFYIELLIYHLVLETIASEHSSRMVAMKNATDNASEMLEDLTLTYNQARQQNITRQIAEITSAREALNHYE